MAQASILVVEDEAIVALDLKMQLEEMGYDVAGTAESGAQALDLARSRRPTLALMDVMLKGDMDGIEVADIFGRSLEIPVVFLTSFSDAETVRRAARTAPYGYLTKPFQIKELRAAIEVALQKSRMERQLRDSERWFASTLRCVQDGVIVTEPDASVRFLNPAAEDMTGWRLEEAAGRPVSEIVDFGHGSGDNSAVRALREGRVIGIEHAKRLQMRDGRELPVDESAAPVQDGDGLRLGAVLVLRDISERLQHEDRLRASEERFRSAFDFAPLGMALVSLDGRFIQANDALCRLLGCESGWLRQRSLSDVSHPDEHEHERRRLHELLVSPLPVTQFEQRYLRCDSDEPVWALVSVSLLREAEEPVCYLYQVHDLSAQKRAAEQLAEMASVRLRHEASEQASRTKSEFLSRMSHEMRTPLNAVIGFAQLLKMQGTAAGANAASYSEHILNAGQHLLALVNDVLDLQRATEGRLQLKMVPVSLCQSVSVTEQFLMPMAHAQQIVFDNQVPADCRVRVDEMRLRQVLLNLGSNAIKYNHTGGRVRWTAESVAPDRMRLVIEDDGVGMTADELSRLFQPFERLGRESTAIPGSGLGLVITRRLVEDMGGTLALSSERGVGTRVSLEFAAG
jgi:PAS domain S-box-containing protein